MIRPVHQHPFVFSQLDHLKETAKETSLAAKAIFKQPPSSHTISNAQPLSASEESGAAKAFARTIASQK